MMVSTNEFKDLIFGKEKDGKREGGLVGSLKEGLSPLTKLGTEIKDKLFEEECWYIIKNILTNIKEASNVFYKVKCYKKYLKKDLNIFDI